MSETDPYECRNTATVENVAGHSRLGQRALRIAFNVNAGRMARVSTPVTARPDVAGYATVSTPLLYTGMTAILTGTAGTLEGVTRARLFIRVLTGGKWSESTLSFGKALTLKSKSPFSLSLPIPDTKGCAVIDFGIEISSRDQAKGEVFVDSIRFTGKAQVAFPSQIPRDGDAPGWIRHAEHFGGSFSDDPGDFTHAGRNTERGILVTGNTGWTDYTFEATVKIHMADKGGILVRYQGMQRYIALVWTANQKLQLIERHYGDTILAETPCRWKLDQPHALKLTCKGRTITASCDGRKILEGVDGKLGRGGAGLVFEKGMIGFNSVKVS